MAEEHTIDVKVDPDVLRSVRWTQSPLRRALNGVQRAAASRHKSGRRIADNLATINVVGAAEELAEILDGIDAGRLDGMGYPHG
jgi:hypothetical protein